MASEAGQDDEAQPWARPSSDWNCNEGHSEGESASGSELEAGRQSVSSAAFLRTFRAQQRAAAAEREAAVARLLATEIALGEGEHRANVCSSPTHKSMRCPNSGAV